MRIKVINRHSSLSRSEIAVTMLSLFITRIYCYSKDSIRTRFIIIVPSSLKSCYTIVSTPINFSSFHRYSLFNFSFFFRRQSHFRLLLHSFIRAIFNFDRHGFMLQFFFFSLTHCPAIRTFRT